MSKPAITSIWDWSAHYLAAMFLVHQQHREGDTTFSAWMDKDNIRRVYIYDELEDDGFVEYYKDGVAQGVRIKEDVYHGE